MTNEQQNKVDSWHKKTGHDGDDDVVAALLLIMIIIFDDDAVVVGADDENVAADYIFGLCV